MEEFGLWAVSKILSQTDGQGRDEQVNKLAVYAPGVEALCDKLRHKGFAAPCPAMEAEHQGLGRGGVAVVSPHRADDKVSSQVLASKMTVKKLLESRDADRSPAGGAALKPYKQLTEFPIQPSFLLK